VCADRHRLGHVVACKIPTHELRLSRSKVFQYWLVRDVFGFHEINLAIFHRLVSNGIVRVAE